MSRRRMRGLVALLAAATLAVSAHAAQRGFGRGGRFEALKIATPGSFDGAFNFCRVIFRASPYGDGSNWSVDYPRADENLSIRLSELTKTTISKDADGNPNHLLVRLTDPELFQCPFVMMTEVGASYLDDEEAAKLREYLLKGGFLWVDDFWGTRAWANWAAQLSKVLPAASYPVIDLPMDHPMFHTLFDIPHVPQVPSINFWAGSGGGTSERGFDSADAHARAVLDDHGRIMVFMTHNTDLGDAFEREGDNHEYFLRFSVDGYAMAIDVLIYAMSH